MFGLYDDPRLYDVARAVCHRYGIPWTDPRSGETVAPPLETITVDEEDPDDELDDPAGAVEAAVQRELADTGDDTPAGTGPDEDQGDGV